MPSRRPGAPRTALAALAGATALVLALNGCGGSDDDPAEPAPTSVGDLDGGLDVPRAAFCDRVPGDAVAAALGEDATADSSWGNGDPAPGTPGEIAHELGCSWTGVDGAAARAWVFARPVGTTEAAALARTARKGCTTPTDPGFGTPTLTQVCPVGTTTRVRYAGLFGTTWLTCELVAPGKPAQVRARAGTWCAAVATAAAS